MAINEEIFLGSGATLTLVPEVDLYVEILHSQTGAGYDSGDVRTKLKVHGDFAAEYLLVDNLYVGCVLDLYDGASSTTQFQVILLLQMILMNLQLPLVMKLL